ncbi:MAG: AmmeMemoRadiSam system protein B [Candidatus Omnitrophica bacterium]|nr:AmmeMemoRadiSam system protein B [Candidatus Omnitrophota bacterium]
MKRPNVSGQFYPSNPKQLSSLIDTFFSQADVKPLNQHIDVVIVPHAGYVYSGPVAAYGFKAVSKNQYKTIVILAASHYFPFDGISIWQKGGFETPLGLVSVDEEFTKKLVGKNPKFYDEPSVFEQEHSLEVEIPFLQKTFKDFKIVPVLFGQPDLKTIASFASALKDAVGDRDDVLVIASSDMSHYHDDATARAMDKKTIDTILAYDIESFWKGCDARTIEMCGFMPVTAALLYAREKGLDRIEDLHYANSSDVTGDKNRVVGYTSVIIYNSGKQTKKKVAANESEEGVKPLAQAQKDRLLTIARQTMEEYVRRGKVLDVKEADPRLSEEEGAFVTIQKNGQLRGCIGNIIGRGPLYLTVRDMAIACSTEDPRFSPVKDKELKDLHVEISVLSKPRLINNVDEIVLGKHGVIVSKGAFNQGVFLPQVATETGWSKEEFLSELCSQKAGLPSDCWKDPATKMYIFTAQVFSEKEEK